MYKQCIGVYIGVCIYIYIRIYRYRDYILIYIYIYIYVEVQGPLGNNPNSPGPALPKLFRGLRSPDFSLAVTGPLSSLSGSCFVFCLGDQKV